MLRNRSTNLLVLGVGNPGREDDGLGQRFAVEAEALLAQGLIGPATIRHRYQLNVEDSELFRRFELVLTVDAAVDATRPFELRRVEPAATMPFTTHGLALPQLLHLGAALYDDLPPVFQLALRGERFGIGLGLSPMAQASLEAALRWLCEHHGPAAQGEVRWWNP